MTMPQNKVVASDVRRLRELAGRIRELAEGERNRRLVDRWYALDEGRAGRPLILAETDGGLNMVAPDLRPQCQEEWARQREWALLGTLLHAELLRDDSPVEPCVAVPWRISVVPGSGWDFEVKHAYPEGDFAEKTAFHIEPPIKDLAAELERVVGHHGTFQVDREGTLAEKALLEEVFGGILEVRLRGNPWWTQGLTQTAIDLIGLENLMLYMYEQPEALHALLAFLADGRIRQVQWMEREGLLCLNNEDDYTGSGSRGYTHALPQAGFQEGRPRARDLWCLVESQETVGVGPEQYEDFVFREEQRVAALFGRVYVGCCEPLHTRWNVVKRMPNLKRASVSPWCDQAFMAAAMGGNYVFSRKPNPALISGPVFDEALIRADLRQTLELTKAHGCPAEIIMKDVHTLGGEPWRLARWVELARETADTVYG
ncbi:MAG: hypothetical protein WC708_14770 [Lentisphaeria bacterium]